MNVSSNYIDDLYTRLGDLKSDYRNQNLYTLILSRLGGRSVLDIGCGVGHFLHLAKQSGMKVYGLEPNRKLISLGRKLYKERIKIIEGSIEELPGIELCVDNITLIDVLEHIDDDVIPLRDVREKLSNKGKLIILVPAFQSLYGERDRKLGHFRRYSVAGLRQKLRSNGYDIVEIRFWNLIGLLPYFISNKLLRRAISSDLRSSKRQTRVSFFLNRLLFYWFRYVENSASFGAGLSLLCVAVPRRDLSRK